MVKIGYTTNWEKREKEHTASVLGHHPDFTCLCLVRGSRSDETFVHRYLSSVRWPGESELFRPVSLVVDYIRWLRDQYYVWIPDDELCPVIEDLPVISSSLWVPAKDRRKKPSGMLPFDGPLALPPRFSTCDDFYTNKLIIKAARKCFGAEIDLDPASHAIANTVVQAKQIYTLADDGLTLPWAGNVWLNPPFSQWASWVPKILNEWARGEIHQMCILCATRTLTAKYFAPLVAAAEAVCIIRGRLSFWGSRAGPSPDDGHAVFYFGNKRDKFSETFSDIGTTYLSTMSAQDQH